MSNKMMKVLGVVVVGLGILASTTQGCGGGSGGGAPSASQIATICNQSCTTAVRCFGGIVTMATCVQECTAGAQTAAGATCSNVSDIVAKAQSCASMTDCTAFEACSQSIPKCSTGAGGSSSTGAGGTTSVGSGGSSSGGTSGGMAGTTGAAGVFGSGGVFGTGGVLGSGGTSGSTCDTACKKADECVTAIDALGGGAVDAGAANFQSTCDGVTAAEQATIVMSCNQYLATIAPILGAQEPAACK